MSEQELLTFLSRLAVCGLLPDAEAALTCATAIVCERNELAERTRAARELLTPNPAPAK